MTKTFAILAGLGVAALLVGTARNQAPDPQALAAELARLDRLSVPVGGVILWWGLESEIPENFEVCDGRPPKDRDAKFKHRKPELRGRFPFGAPNEFRFRPWEENTGGSNTLAARTEPAAITVPVHDHGMAHTHDLGNHRHSIPTTSGHTHGLVPSKNAHRHSLNGHTHAFDHQHLMTGNFKKHDIGPEITDPKAPGTFVLVETGTTATGGPVDSKGKSSPETEGPLPQDTGDPKPPGSTTDTPAAKTNTDTPLDNASGSPKPSAKTDPAGTSQDHDHEFEIKDIRPAFTEFLFIIRVK